ncbi:uridine kinase family protein [Portibacter lacus]|uniref:Uridine kinase n=1 Tax=Portibacter lacus TaxID=1099794 RepID=A0AA37SPD3_9BACT|nr:P-loop NTPase fold protein [Portibacter lacus]GLR16308.1 uridine kinase [Portibacter lacus]
MNQPIVIGISGGSGSGKTSFIKKLRSVFNEEEICIISQDDYYRPRDEQVADAQGVKNFDLPVSIDDEELIYDIIALKDGKTVTRQEYTFNNETKTPGIITMKSAPVIIVEGLFVLHFEKIRKALDYSIFIEAKENLKVIRRIKRDQLERNYPLEDVLYRYENHVMIAFDKYIAPYKELTDIVINNNVNFDKGFEILVGFIKSKTQ